MSSVRFQVDSKKEKYANSYIGDFAYFSFLNNCLKTKYL